MIGLAAELLTRTYYEAQHKPIYTIRHMLPDPMIERNAIQLEDYMQERERSENSHDCTSIRYLSSCQGTFKYGL